MPDRRHTDEQLVQIRALLREELKGRNSWIKNGDTWPQYVARILSGPNLLMLGTFVLSAVTFIFVLGGRAVKLETAAQEALTTAKATALTNARLSEELAQMRTIIGQQAKALEGAPTPRSIADLEARIRMAVTRSEFQSAIQQQILPRLARIEQQGRP